MKAFLSTVILVASVAVTGCDKSSTGGPGATPPKNTTNPATTGGTFTLTVSDSSIDLVQGEAKAMSVTINRNDNFQQDVTLEFTGLPKGTSVDPARPTVKHGSSEAKFTIKADADAAVGDFTFKMVGRPSKGLDSVTDMDLTVVQK